MAKPSQTQHDFSPEVLEAFDDLVHGRIDRREFLRRASTYAVGGMTAAGMLAALTPRYAGAEEVNFNDPRLHAEYMHFPSPQNWEGYLVHPADATGNLGAVLVIHENRGRNPYIEDVTRRFGVAGFLAMSPDALTPFGGWPGNDDEGRALQDKQSRDVMFDHWVAAYNYLKNHPMGNGKVGAVGFCYGGGVVNQLAVTQPGLTAGVPFYGSQPDSSEVKNIQAAMLIHNGELDDRIMAGKEEYDRALRQAGVTFESYVYEDSRHGFHNNSTPRYNETTAELAEQRTMDWFSKYLT